MARNLLQASDVYSHRPIALKEAPDAWEIAAGIADTLFDPEQARADRELEYEKEMADKNYQLAQETLALDRQKSEAQISASKESSALAEKTFEANLFRLFKTRGSVLLARPVSISFERSKA